MFYSRTEWLETQEEEMFQSESEGREKPATVGGNSSSKNPFLIREGSSS